MSIFSPDIGDRVTYTYANGSTQVDATVVSNNAVLLQTGNALDNHYAGPVPANAPVGSVTINANPVVFESTGGAHTAYRAGGSLRDEQQRYSEKRFPLLAINPWGYEGPRRSDTISTNSPNASQEQVFSREEAETSIAIDVTHKSGSSITVNFYNVLIDGSFSLFHAETVTTSPDPAFQTVLATTGYDKDDPTTPKMYGVEIISGPASGGIGTWKARYLRTNGGDPPP